jgi:hypothetical protein
VIDADITDLIDPFCHFQAMLGQENWNGRFAPDYEELIIISRRLYLKFVYKGNPKTATDGWCSNARGWSQSAEGALKVDSHLPS